jgi:MoxR-like ATPase
MLETMHITPTQATAAIAAALNADLPFFLEGAPGIGKSAIAKQAAQAAGLEFRDIRLPLLDPVDLRGIPSVANGRTKWNPPSFLPREDEAPTLLFFDELSAAAPAMQAAAYQIIWDRACGEYQLPAHTRIGAAGNRQSDKAVAYRVSSALRSRFISLTMKTSQRTGSNGPLGPT